MIRRKRAIYTKACIGLSAVTGVIVYVVNTVLPIGFTVMSFMLAMVVAYFILSKLADWTTKVSDSDQKTMPAVERVYTKIPQCIDGITWYLKTNESTSQFRSEFEGIVDSLRRLDRQITSLESLLDKLFGSWRTSYHTFNIPIQNFKTYACKITKTLLVRFEAFDEAECYDIVNNRHSRHTSEFRQKNKELLEEYLLFVREVNKAIEDMSIRLDHLVFQITKSDEINPTEVTEMLTGMDSLIKDADYYRLL